MIRLAPLFAFLSLLIAGPAAAQLSVDVTDESGAAKLKVAVPAFPTDQVAATPAGSTDALGRAVAQVVADDLRNSGLFAPSGPGGMRAVSMAEVTAPAYASWGGYEAVVHGFVRSAGGNNDITGWGEREDVALRTELTRQAAAIHDTRGDRQIRLDI